MCFYYLKGGVKDDGNGKNWTSIRIAECHWKNHTQTIRNAYRKVIKINKKNETLTPELSSEAKAAMYLLIERRKRMKSEVVIQRDAQLHDEIRVRMNAKKFFAPRLWFKIALPIIIWAILQEIIMASTDIVDNIFVNWMKDDQIQGLAQLQDDIKTFEAMLPLPTLMRRDYRTSI
jgi:hypothetical protein